MEDRGHLSCLLVVLVSYWLNCFIKNEEVGEAKGHVLGEKGPIYLFSPPSL
jgi:hypothetical protein